MKKNKELIFVVVSFILLLVLTRSQFKWHDLLQLMRTLQLKYILLALLFMLGYLGLEAYMIKTLIHQMTRNQESIKGDITWIALKTTLVGQYYSHITPFSSGGQPMQLFHLKKHNISVSQGTGVLVSKFLFYQVTITLYALILAFFHMDFIKSANASVVMTLTIGLTINTVGLLFIIMVAFKPDLLTRFLHKLILWLDRFTWFKNADAKIEKLDHFVEEYTQSLNELKNNLLNTLKLFVLSFIQISMFFSITVLIYRALGLSGATIVQIITLQSIVYMCVSFVPIPGTLGASELGFNAVLTAVFTNHFIGLAMILWRLISYYFSLILCGTFTIAVSYYQSRRVRIS